MIKKIIYEIRFPFGGYFNKPVQYLFIKDIYQRVKEQTCLNEDKKCINCSKKDQCIYYYISGENFNNPAGLVINKSFYENKTFKPNERINLIFYLIGKCQIYQNFIFEYMENTMQIYGKYFQKIKLLDRKDEEFDTYTGEIRCITPIKDYEEVITTIKYYNEKYQTNFDTQIDIHQKRIRKVYDETIYAINNRRFKLFGNTGIFEVRNYPKILFDIGVGRENVIGGGRFKCD